LAVLEQDYDLRDKEKIMPDIRTRVETVSNAGATQATLGVNFERVNVGNGIGPRTLIVTLKNTGDANAVVPHATALAFIRAVEQAGGVPPNDRNGPDAFTIAGVSGTNEAATGGNRGDSAAGGFVFALQGTGTLDVTIADHTVATVAAFDQRVIPG